MATYDLVPEHIASRARRTVGDGVRLLAGTNGDSLKNLSSRWDSGDEAAVPYMDETVTVGTSTAGDVSLRRRSVRRLCPGGAQAGNAEPIRRWQVAVERRSGRNVR